MDKKNAHYAMETNVTDNLKNLSLGGLPTPPSSTYNKAKGQGKDKDRNKDKKAKKSSVLLKKATPILLGMPDSLMESQDDVDPYTTKIGGVPLWLQKDLPAPSRFGICEACGKQLYLLIQAYVPLEKSAYDRVVYVWACNQRLCMRKKGSFRVARALKLNQEYAQKLEKKAKPAATSSATKPLPAANPFAAPGAFDMGNALFGGASSGFNSPFATPVSNGFAPPAGFGVSAGFGAPAAPPTPLSFASATAFSLPEKNNSNDDKDEQIEVKEESRNWPQSIVSFSPHYLYITEEVIEDSDTEDEIAQRYAHFAQLEQDTNDEDSEGGASWGGEAYEKSSLPKGMDKAFQKFTERVQSWPDQCVRYDFPGIPLLFSYSDSTAQQLLPPNTKLHSKHVTPSAHRIPRCPACKGPRGFEFQLMPNLLSLLAVTSQKYLSPEEKASLNSRKGADLFNIGMEWGTILVYSCVEDCFGKGTTASGHSQENGDAKVKYFEEVALVQFED
ncbi:hypothetical protein BG004_007537 [Podila humilis]|nr:hypothetical protein BG004_007537 [Podila humilis]